MPTCARRWAVPQRTRRTPHTRRKLARTTSSRRSLRPSQAAPPRGADRSLPVLATQEDLERQQRPEAMAVVDRTCGVLGEETIDACAVEVVAHSRIRGAQRAGDVARKILAEPAVHGHTKALLAALDDRRREQGGHRGLED